MDEIAAEARVSKGTLYNYFDSKESLLVASILAHYEETAERIEEAMPAADDPIGLLHRMTGLMVDLFPEILSDMLVNFQAWGVAAQHPEARGTLFSALRDLYGDRGRDLEKLVAAGQARGDVDPAVDPARFTRSWLAIFDGFVYRAAFDPDGARPEHLRACLEDHVERALIHRRPSPAEERGE